jgi:DNA repair protein RadA/Sms
MVDAVLYFESESESGGRFRLIRAVKNRFGAANEIGIFAMTERGLREVGSPSAIFLSREGPEAPGSVVTVTRQGTRPLLVELQALVDVAQGAHPRRVSVGLDANRLSLLLAVLHRHAGIDAHDQDVYLNVVGGVRLGETGADLPALMAVASSLRGRPVPRALVAFGEVGLTGEVRPVYNGEERLLEAAKHGFTRAVVPRGNLPRRAVPGMEVSGVQRVAEALDRL